MPRVRRDVRLVVYVQPPVGQLVQDLADERGLSTSELLRSIVVQYVQSLNGR